MIDLNKKSILAPMAGVTEPVFRQICREQGADIVLTEMISADGLFYNSKKTLEMAKVFNNERPCGVQLFGSDPEKLANAVKVVVDYTNPEYIDLNAGCPVKKVISKNGGSALLKDEILFGKVIEAMAKATSTPVTVKIRYGWLKGEYLDTKLGKIAEESGAAAIAIHARSRSMLYTGVADWSRIKALKESVNIPVIGNGDIFKWQDAIKMYEETGCDSIMLARGTNGNPWLFKQIKQAMSGESVDEITFIDKVKTARRHFQVFVETYDGLRNFGEMKKHLSWYFKGFPAATHLRNAVFRCDTQDEILKVIEEAERVVGEHLV